VLVFIDVLLCMLVLETYFVMLMFIVRYYRMFVLKITVADCYNITIGALVYMIMIFTFLCSQI